MSKTGTTPAASDLTTAIEEIRDRITRGARTRSAAARNAKNTRANDSRRLPDDPRSQVVTKESLAELRRPEVGLRTIDPGVAAIQVRGELDLATVGQLEAEIDRVLTAGSPPLLIDLTDCGFIDTSVVGLLIKLRVTLANGGRPRVAVVAADQPRSVLRLTGLDQEMRVFASLPEALRALDPSAPEPSQEVASQIVASGTNF
jgi:anti-sigma B factor antagonist